VAGALPGPCWGSLQHSLKSPSSIKGPTSKGKGRKGRGGGAAGRGRGWVGSEEEEGKWYPHFWGESYAPTEDETTTWQYVVVAVAAAVEWYQASTAAESYCTVMMATDQLQGSQGQSSLQMLHQRQLKI